MLGSCRAGRYTDMVNDLGRHLTRFSPFFVLHDNKDSPSRSRLSQNSRGGFEDFISKKKKLPNLAP
jgi:hypothetical protein